MTISNIFWDVVTPHFVLSFQRFNWTWWLFVCHPILSQIFVLIKIVMKNRRTRNKILVSFAAKLGRIFLSSIVIQKWREENISSCQRIKNLNFKITRNVKYFFKNYNLIFIEIFQQVKLQEMSNHLLCNIQRCKRLSIFFSSVSQIWKDFTNWNQSQLFLGKIFRRQFRSIEVY